MATVLMDATKPVTVMLVFKNKIKNDMSVYGSMIPFLL